METEEKAKEQYYYLTSDYNWTNENIGIKGRGYSDMVIFEDIIKRTTKKAVTKTILFHEITKEKTCEISDNVRIIVEVLPNNMVKDIITGAEFEIRNPSKTRIYFSVTSGTGRYYSLAALSTDEVADYLRSFNEDDINRYRERMLVFQDAIKNVEKGLLDKSTDNIQYIRDFKARYNNKDNNKE